jgi:phosphoribosyl-AMP cyclohydrolase
VTPNPDQTDPVTPTAVATLPEDVAALLKRTPDGLVPAIAQDATTGRVLMMAWMNDEALALTLSTGRGTYWSRSRATMWVKGEESGHRQWVRRVELDCDGDTLLLQVDQEGAACHLGTTSCFDTHLLPLAAEATGGGPR